MISALDKESIFTVSSFLTAPKAIPSTLKYRLIEYVLALTENTLLYSFLPFDTVILYV